jgi:hypothetical protein
MLGELPEHHHQPLLLEQYLEYLSILPLQRPLKLYKPIGIHNPHLLRQLRLLNIGHLLTLGFKYQNSSDPISRSLVPLYISIWASELSASSYLRAWTSCSIISLSTLFEDSAIILVAYYRMTFMLATGRCAP